MQIYEITAKRTAFYTFDQNEKIKRSEKILIIKTKIMRISNHLLKNLWSEIYKIDDYINNRISKRNLKWLISYETLFEKKFNLFYLHSYDCRAYFFRQKIFKKNKLKFRAIIDYFVDYDSINIFRIWMLSKTKMIKTKNVIFDHSKFYDFIKLNLIHILIFSIKSIVEMLNLSKMQLTFNEIEKFEKFEKNFIFIENVEQLNKISSIKNIITKSIEKKNLKKTRTLMSIFEITSKVTSKRTVIQKKNFDFIFIQKMSNSIKKFRKIINFEMLSDAIAMNIKFRKQTYVIIMNIFSDFAFFHSTFAMKLIKLKIDSKIRLHRNSFSIEFQYWKQILKHRCVKKFQLTAIREIEKFAQRKIYKLIEKKNQNQIKIFFIWIFKYKFDTDDYFIKFKTRLCVKRDFQTIYENTYATILTAKIFRVVMTIAVAFDMKIHQFDAINAFVNNKFNEEILCECFKKFRQSNKYWKLFRTLYDLKQISML